MIKLLNISKRFMFRPEGRSILFKGIVEAFKKQERRKIIWALDDVNIDINKGETIGLIGPNGSGKSTLLKIVCGIYKPTFGTVSVGGDVTPLLKLGVGFLPDLSVKDNVFLYATIMGLDRNGINKNFKRIIDFAGLSGFINAEARTLSLGMEERLAFSVAVQNPGDILLFDETFAAGDYDFKKQCLKTLDEFKKIKKTVILASHDLDVIDKYCDRVLLLRHGRVEGFGRADKIIDKYKSFSNGQKA